MGHSPVHPGRAGRLGREEGGVDPQVVLGDGADVAGERAVDAVGRGHGRHRPAVTDRAVEEEPHGVRRQRHRGQAVTEAVPDPYKGLLGAGADVELVEQGPHHRQALRLAGGREVADVDDRVRVAARPVPDQVGLAARWRRRERPDPLHNRRGRPCHPGDRGVAGQALEVEEGLRAGILPAVGTGQPRGLLRPLLGPTYPLVAHSHTSAVTPHPT